MDFEHPEFREHRAAQLELLDRLQIPHVTLEGRYSLDAIRRLYRRAAALLLQRPESFGMPIAECFATGAWVVIPHSGWAMAWRLDDAPRQHGPGRLGESFVAYDGLDDLADRLRSLQAAHDPVRTPREVHARFLATYPSFWSGDRAALAGFLDRAARGGLG